MSYLRVNVKIIADSLKNSSAKYLSDISFINGIIEKKPEKLKNVQIKKFLGSGAYKIAFLLSNGNVLSIFAAGMDSNLQDVSGEFEVRKFKKIQEMLKTGKANKHEPVIHDTGFLHESVYKYKIGPDVQQENIEYFYVEMGYLKSIFDWAEKTNKIIDGVENIFSSTYFIYADASIEFSKIYKESLQSFEKFLELPFKLKKLNPKFQEYVKELAEGIKLSKMTHKEVNLLMFALYTIITKYSKETFPDFHEGNVGVLPDSVNTDNPIFVFFDF